MRNHSVAAVLTCGVLYAGVALAQVSAPNPTQSSAAAPSEQTPIFRVTVVGRTTLGDQLSAQAVATRRWTSPARALMPAATGKAEVSGEKGYIKIEAEFDKLAAPAQFGPEYLTYVLWAITPEGRATNLGEVQRDDNDARVEVTTELQAFGLILTAEPYFAVTQPSDVVVMENVIRDSTKGNVETIQAKYELLKRGSYLMNQDATRLKIKPLEPGAPLDLAQARNAVELARLAGADRYAADTFNKASGLLATAELAREKKRGSNDIMMPARQAAQTAEDARLVGLQRQEEALVAEQRRVAAVREQEALSRAQAEEARRRQAELEAQNASAARAAAERQTQEAAARAQAAAGRSGGRAAGQGGGRSSASRRRRRACASRGGATRRRGAGRTGPAACRQLRAGEGAAA